MRANDTRSSMRQRRRTTLRWRDVDRANGIIRRVTFRTSQCHLISQPPDIAVGLGAMSKGLLFLLVTGLFTGRSPELPCTLSLAVSARWRKTRLPQTYSCVCQSRKGPTKLHCKALARRAAPMGILLDHR